MSSHTDQTYFVHDNEEYVYKVERYTTETRVNSQFKKGHSLARRQS